MIAHTALPHFSRSMRRVSRVTSTSYKKSFQCASTLVFRQHYFVHPLDTELSSWQNTWLRQQTLKFRNMKKHGFQDLQNLWTRFCNFHSVTYKHLQIKKIHLSRTRKVVTKPSVMGTSGIFQAHPVRGGIQKFNRSRPRKRGYSEVQQEPTP